MTRLRMPAITGATTEQRLQQLTAYLRYLAGQLNELLDQLEGGS